MFHSVTKCPILAKGDEDDLDVPVRTRVAIDELHILTGSFPCQMTHPQSHGKYHPTDVGFL